MMRFVRPTFVAGLGALVCAFLLVNGFAEGFVTGEGFELSTASAQSNSSQDKKEWSVEGGSDRKREIVRRYKRLLEKNPTEGVIFEKLVEYVGDSGGVERLVAQYRRKVEANPESTWGGVESGGA